MYEPAAWVDRAIRSVSVSFFLKHNDVTHMFKEANGNRTHVTTFIKHTSFEVCFVAWVVIFSDHTIVL